MGKNEPMENSEKKICISSFLMRRKPETQTLVVGLVIRNFCVQLILNKWQPFFIFFKMADADIPFPSTLGKLETQTLGVQ